MTKVFAGNVFITKSKSAMEQMFFGANRATSFIQKAGDLEPGQLAQSFIVSPGSNRGLLSFEFNYVHNKQTAVKLRIVENSELLEFVLCDNDPLASRLSFLLDEKNKLNTKIAAAVANSQAGFQGIDTSPVVEEEVVMTAEGLNEASKLSNTYYFAFGLGDNLETWDGPHSMALGQSSLSNDENNVRIITAEFMPNLNSIKGWSRVFEREMGYGNEIKKLRGYLTADSYSQAKGKVHISIPRVKSKGSQTPQRQPNWMEKQSGKTEWYETLMGVEGNTVGKTNLNMPIRQLIKNYIGAINGDPGNVVVVIPDKFEDLVIGEPRNKDTGKVDLLNPGTAQIKKESMDFLTSLGIKSEIYARNILKETKEWLEDRGEITNAGQREEYRKFIDEKAVPTAQKTVMGFLGRLLPFPPFAPAEAPKVGDTGFTGRPMPFTPRPGDIKKLENTNSTEKKGQIATTVIPAAGASLGTAIAHDIDWAYEQLKYLEEPAGADIVVTLILSCINEGGQGSISGFKPLFSVINKLAAALKGSKADESTGPYDYFEYTDVRILKLWEKYKIIGDGSRSAFVYGDQREIKKLLFLEDWNTESPGDGDYEPSYDSGGRSFFKQPQKHTILTVFRGGVEKYKEYAQDYLDVTTGSKGSSFALDNSELNMLPKPLSEIWDRFEDIGSRELVFKHNIPNSNVIALDYDIQNYHGALNSYIVRPNLDKQLLGSSRISVTKRVAESVVTEKFLEALVKALELQSQQKLPSEGTKIRALLASYLQDPKADLALTTEFSKQVVKYKYLGAYTEASLISFLVLALLEMTSTLNEDSTFELLTPPERFENTITDIYDEYFSYLPKVTVKTLPFFNHNIFPGKKCALVGLTGGTVGSDSKLKTMAPYTGEYIVTGWKHYFDTTEMYSTFKMQRIGLRAEGASIGTSQGAVVALREKLEAEVKRLDNMVAAMQEYIRSGSMWGGPGVEAGLKRKKEALEALISGLESQ